MSVFLALLIQHATGRQIVIFGVSASTTVFQILS